MSPLREAQAGQGQEAARPPTVHFARGELLCKRGESGAVFRIVRGAVRLDFLYAAGKSGFGGLALAGDVIGHELLSQPGYGFSASALTPVTVEPIDVDGICDPAAVSRLLAAS